MPPTVTRPLDRTGGKFSPRTGTLVLVLLGIAILLRSVFLTSQSFWMDEGFSVFMAQTDGSTFLRTLHREMNMALYYALLRLWIHLGASEFCVRLLSVIASAATVPVVYSIGQRLFSRRVGLIAALLLAVHPSHIALAQEARSYALEGLLVSLFTLFLLRFVQLDSRIDYVAYVGTAILALYSHILSILVIIAQCFALLVRIRRSQMRPILRRFAITALCGLPLLWPIFVYVLRNGNSAVNWIPPPSWQDLRILFPFLTFAKYGLLYVLGWLAAFWMLRKPNREWQRWPVVFVSCWLILPVLFILLISIYKPMLVARFLSQCIPASVLLAAVGFETLKRPLNGILVFLTVATSLGAVRATYRHQWKEDWRGASAYVFSASTPGDAVIVLPEYGRFTFSYYRRLRGLRSDQLPYSSLAGNAEETRGGARRLWLLVPGAHNLNPVASQAIESVMAASAGAYCIVQASRFNQIEVWLLEKCR